VIRSHQLLHFIQDLQIPKGFATIAYQDVGRVTKAYRAWEQQDQLMLSWLQSIISALILFIRCTSSWFLWDVDLLFFDKVRGNEREIGEKTDIIHSEKSVTELVIKRYI